jgi:hypothetical protein
MYETSKEYEDAEARHPPLMKGTYKITLFNGNHGIWCLVGDDDGTIFEQAGLKSVEEALKYALSAITYEESK